DALVALLLTLSLDELQQKLESLADDVMVDLKLRAED
ncbi:glycine cleavage system protein R, partial [Arthrobacter stackebrandtii]